MGRVTLRGRARPVDVLTPRPDLEPGRRARIAALVAAHDAGDEAAFVTCATDLRGEMAQDAAVMFLIDRLTGTEKGESHVLS
jgi:adenylate cyclase